QNLSDFAKGRRRLLRSAAAWVGAGAALVAARSAGAWQIEEIAPESPLGAALANRCRGPSEHAGLVAQLQAQLAKEPSVSSLTATCPICGCPVIVSR
ncbi:MAG TPA: hypothetical protein VFW40_05655, partial [Capsulimonadaceae bacterium]|nr:hypothetical protein [Capsulimonadaceae bacterium]